MKNFNIFLHQKKTYIFAFILISAYNTFITGIKSASAAVVEKCDATALLNAVKDTPSGGTITFHCPDNSIINLTSEIILSKDLIIDGIGVKNLVISGQNKTRIFRSAKNLTIKNLILQRGMVLSKNPSFSCEGGAIHITFGKLILENVTLKNNFAARGGAVCGNWRAQVEINNSRFFQNSANLGGAVMTNTTDLSILDSRFIQNSTRNSSQGIAGNGGALFTFDVLNKNIPVTIENTRFDRNTAYNEGGAASIALSNGGTFDLRNSTFVKNQALLNPTTGIGSGGALKIIQMGSLSTANLTNVVFANNIADQEGGAIWAGGARSNLNLNFDFVTFYGNGSGRVPDPQLNETAGGAILFQTGTGQVVFDHTTFAKNQANNETGGGIWIDTRVVNRNNVTLRNSIFEDNCSIKDIRGTTKVEYCVNLNHADNVTGPFQDQGNRNNYEWPANVNDPKDIPAPLTALINIQQVNVRPYIDNGDAIPDHPLSDVNSGSGGAVVGKSSLYRRIQQKNNSLRLNPHSALLESQKIITGQAHEEDSIRDNYCSRILEYAVALESDSQSV